MTMRNSAELGHLIRQRFNRAPRLLRREFYLSAIRHLQKWQRHDAFGQFGVYFFLLNAIEHFINCVHNLPQPSTLISPSFDRYISVLSHVHRHYFLFLLLFYREWRVWRVWRGWSVSKSG